MYSTTSARASTPCFCLRFTRTIARVAASVLEVAAIKVVPVKLAKGELGSHYRLGWEEKSKAGKSLVQDKNIVDLPDRMPEGLKLPGHSDPGSVISDEVPR